VPREELPVARVQPGNLCARAQARAGASFGSLWRADVLLEAWQPQFEITHRRLVPTGEALDQLIGQSVFPAGLRRSTVESLRSRGCRSDSMVLHRKRWRKMLRSSLRPRGAGMDDEKTDFVPHAVSRCGPADGLRHRAPVEVRPHRSGLPQALRLEDQKVMTRSYSACALAASTGVPKPLFLPSKSLSETHGPGAEPSNRDPDLPGRGKLRQLLQRRDAEALNLGGDAVLDQERGIALRMMPASCPASMAPLAIRNGNVAASGRPSHGCRC